MNNNNISSEIPQVGSEEDKIYINLTTTPQRQRCYFRKIFISKIQNKQFTILISEAKEKRLYFLNAHDKISPLKYVTSFVYKH